MSDDLAGRRRSSLALRGLKSFFVGGANQRLDLAPSEAVALALGSARRTLEQSGDYQVGQMYVQGYLVAERNGAPPLLMWHGGGMTGATWETTPDGRAGWLELALRDGFDVYVSDAVERGRASFPPTALTEMAPVFRPKELAWTLFRMGREDGYASRPEARRAFEGQRFPVDAYDLFASQFVARWPALAPTVRAAYTDYVQSFDEAVLVAHSQGCGYAAEAALAHPDRLHAVVLVEPSGAPVDAPPESVRRLRDVPHLVVWGDFFDQSRVWRGYRRTVETHLDALREAGARVDVIDLPAMGIDGNSHFPMMDDNCEVVWGLISDWLRQL